MMDFRPDEEQKMLADTIARFARERVRKVYRLSLIHISEPTRPY